MSEMIKVTIYQYYNVIKTHCKPEFQKKNFAKTSVNGHGILL